MAESICEEDAIVLRLREQNAGEDIIKERYFDAEFGGNSSSMYKEEREDDDILWLRPEEIVEFPEYFIEETTAKCSFIEGTTGETWLLGAMAAICGHPEYLVENLFGSEPDDFKHWGVYTCRFYQDGEWIEVVTDTRLPTLKSKKDPELLSGRCLDSREVWAPLLIKSFAKLKGCYENIQNESLRQGLVYLTGGSAEEIELDGTVKYSELWSLLKSQCEQQNILCCTMKTKTSKKREDDHGLLCDRAYCVLGLREVLDTKFIQLRNPWHAGEGRGDWQGAWSNTSTQWDDFPEVLLEVNSGINNWDRSAADGIFFMTLNDFLLYFDSLFLCRLFPDRSFKQYKIHGRWSQKSAAGPPDHYQEVSRPKKCQASKPRRNSLTMALMGNLENGQHKKRLHTVHMDEDADWFNNPQYRLTTPTEATKIHLSLMYKTSNKILPPLGFELIRTPKSAERGRIFGLSSQSTGLAADATLLPSTVRATDKRTSAVELVYKCNSANSHELSAHDLTLDPGWHYTLCVYNAKRRFDAEFVLRIFSSIELSIHALPETITQKVHGVWKLDAKNETAGGPPLLVSSGTKKNSKLLVPAPHWCLNPQFLLTSEIDSAQSENSKLGAGRSDNKRKKKSSSLVSNTIDIKLVLRRTDTAVDENESASNLPEHEASDDNTRLGIVVCKPLGSSLASEEQRLAAATELRTNALGDPTPVKKSTLKKKKKKIAGLDEQDSEWSTTPLPQNLLPSRKVVFEPNEWHLMSSFNQANVATLFLPGVQRNRIAAGLVVTPCLSEPHLRGSFTLEVHASIPLALRASPDTRSKTISGAWTDTNAGGSHLHASSTINPKYRLHFLATATRAKVSIVLSRPASAWKTQDMVGSMIGFYLSRGQSLLSSEEGVNTAIYHQGRPWNESPFVPLHTVSTPDNFTLDCDSTSGVYTITPATYAPGKTGPFTLSITSDTDFYLLPESSTGPSTAPTLSTPPEKGTCSDELRASDREAS